MRLKADVISPAPSALNRFAFFTRLAARDTLGVAADRASSGDKNRSVGSIEAGIRWLCLAHDVTQRRGVAHSFSLFHGWGPPFPETTGYILQTLLAYGRLVHDSEYLVRAREMGDWEIDIQNPDGGVIHGLHTGERKPSSVFNSGMVLHGWLDLHEAGEDGRFLDAAVRAGRFLTENQDDDGIWRGEIEYNDMPHTYNARVSWALLRLAETTGDHNFRKAAEKQLGWVLSMQQDNGWFEYCIFRPRMQPNAHAIAYTLRGLLESYAICGRESYLNAVRITSDMLLQKLGVDGKLAGNFNRDWRPTAWHECLTGTVQLGGVWLRLYEITGEERFLEAGLKAVARAAARQCATAWPPVYGALPGSHPIYGRYAPFKFPNWATKFLVDGLLKRDELLAEAGRSGAEAASDAEGVIPKDERE